MSNNNSEPPKLRMPSDVLPQKKIIRKNAEKAVETTDVAEADMSAPVRRPRASEPAPRRVRRKPVRRMSVASIIMLILVAVAIIGTAWLLPRLFGNEPLPAVKSGDVITGANRFVSWLSSVVPPVNPSNNPTRATPIETPVPARKQ